MQSTITHQPTRKKVKIEEKKDWLKIIITSVLVAVVFSSFDGMTHLWNFFSFFAKSQYGLHMLTFVTPHIVCFFFLLLDLGIINAKQFAFRKDFSPKTSNVWWCIIDNFLANLGVFSLLTFMSFLGLVDLTNVPEEPPTLLRAIWELGVLFFIWEFVVYPIHKFQHSNFWYKNFHSRHHAGQTFAYSTMSGNLVDEVVSGTAIAIPHLVFPPHPMVFIIYYLYFVSYGVAVHSGYNFPLLNSRFHYYHHVNTNCNFGGMFTFMDKAFGTYKNKVFEWEKEMATPKVTNSRNGQFEGDK